MFTYTVSAADWGRVAPELVLVCMTLVLMLADLFVSQPKPQASKHVVHLRSEGDLVTSLARARDIQHLVLPILSLLGLAGAFIATITLFFVGDQQSAFHQMVGSDQGSLFAYIIILSAAILGVMLSPAYLKRLHLLHQGEYYALIMLATIGMMMLAAATSFLTVFLGLEMLSLALYILCSFVTRRTTSQEAGMKYFLLSSFASTFLLFGIALTYGATGHTAFADIYRFLVTGRTGHSLFHTPTLLLLGMGLLIVGFAFKVSAIPFQAWTPDVYQGAPTPVTAFMSVGTKAAALIAFARVFDVVLRPVAGDWMPVIWAITILTIVGGNILALVQSNLKRLLAYSSIAHAGYLLIGIVAGGTLGLSAILFYLLSYTFLNLGAFGSIAVLEHNDATGVDMQDLRGLWYRRPIIASFLAFFLLALAGFPPMAGFAAKYYLFYGALQSGHPELLIIGVLASVLGMYYYLRPIAVMFMEEEPVAAETVLDSPSLGVVRKQEELVKSAVSTSGSFTTAVMEKEQAAIGIGGVLAGDVSIEEQGTGREWMTWAALTIAVVGTIAMGTILPFWLVNLVQQAAQMMLRI